MPQTIKQREWYLKNRERLLLKAKKYREKNVNKIKNNLLIWVKNNRDKSNAIKKKWADKNKDKNTQLKRNWDRNNVKIRRANVVKRRCSKLRATPKWLTESHLKEMKNIYKNRPNGYHVDHIVPLRGRQVSGLHVPWNLRYLTEKENLIKGNKLK